MNNYYEVQILTESTSEVFNFDNPYMATKKYNQLLVENKNNPHMIVLAFNAPDCYFVSKEHSEGI
jgi:hypothetical protein